MTKGIKLSEFDKGEITDLKRVGKSQREISKALGCSKTIFCDYLKSLNKYGTRKSTGGPEKWSPQFKRRIVHEVKKKTSSRAKILKSLVDAPRITRYGWPAKQTIPLSVLARNQTKGFRTWNLGVAGRGNGTREERFGQRSWESWRRDTERGSRQWTPEQRGEAAWHEGPATVKKIESRCRHSSCFVEFSLVIHASVSPYMLSEM